MAEDKTPTTEEQMRMFEEAEKIRRGEPRQIAILGNVYTLHPISNKIDERVGRLAYDALIYEQEMKDEATKPRRKKRLYTKMRKIPAKMAAYYKLGKRAHIPFLHSIYWHVLWHRSEEVSATINAQEATGANKDFFLANSEVIKYLLALSMRGVGESVKQMLERKESAESMLDEDASPKKEEGSKLAASSKKHR